MTTEVGSEAISYEESKRLAQDADPSVRAALASREDIAPEVLYFLAEDEDPEVRRRVAKNLSAPMQTDLLLAKDSDHEVRSDLAGKIASPVRPETPDPREQVKNVSHEALTYLAKDQMPIVRRILSEAIKDVADAPSEVINILARDDLIDVSGPVLEHSQVLTEDDLIEIIESNPAQGAVSRISRRENIQERVADAVVATDDVEAIADLLSNSTAQIKEQTLDELIDKAESVDLWHAPLVSRPVLPQGSAAKMAHYLAGNLLKVLEERSDLDESTLAQVKQVVHKRLDGGEHLLEDDNDIPNFSQKFLSRPLPLSVVRKLVDRHRLSADMVSRAIDSGDFGFVLAALVTLTKTDEAVGKKIFMEKNAKGMVALCFLSKLPANVSVKVQQRMGRITPTNVIMPEDGDYRMTDEEARWQIDFYASMLHRKG